MVAFHGFINTSQCVSPLRPERCPNSGCTGVSARTSLTFTCVSFHLKTSVPSACSTRKHSANPWRKSSRQFSRLGRVAFAARTVVLHRTRGGQFFGCHSELSKSLRVVLSLYCEACNLVEEQPAGDARNAAQSLETPRAHARVHDRNGDAQSLRVLLGDVFTTRQSRAMRSQKAGWMCRPTRCGSTNRFPA